MTMKCGIFRSKVSRYVVLTGVVSRLCMSVDREFLMSCFSGPQTEPIFDREGKIAYLDLAAIKARWFWFLPPGNGEAVGKDWIASNWNCCRANDSSSASANPS